MNAKIRFWLSLYCFCVLTTDALAEETFHPSRMRFLVHGGYQLTEDLNLRIHFIPAGNLIGPVAPIIHPGLGIKLASWLEMEAVAGWCFATDNPLFSLRVTPTLGDFYAWLDGEYQYPSQNFYWFVQAEYKILDWLQAGVEGEGWGDFKDAPWSNGGGPNLLLRLNHIGADFSLHTRELRGVIKPEFFLRVHVFL